MATTQAPQLPLTIRTRLSPKPHHEVSSHDRRPTHRGALTKPRRHCLQEKAPRRGDSDTPSYMATLARSNHNASAAATVRNKSPAFTGSSSRGELARPTTNTPRCADQGRDVTIHQGKPSRHLSDVQRETPVLLPPQREPLLEHPENETASRDNQRVDHDAPPRRHIHLPTTKPVSRPSCRSV